MYRILPRTAAAVATLAVSATAAAALAGPAGAATTTPTQHFAYGGHAYGSYVNLGGVLDLGKTDNTPMCTTQSGQTNVNKTAKLSLGLAGFIGAVTSQVRGKHSSTTAKSQAQTHTASTTLLGAIHLNAVKTSATVSHTGSKVGYSGNTTFLGLTVAGQSVPGNVPANTSYSLPGLGSLTLNEQHFGVKNGIPTATVIALDVKLGSSNSLGLPAGRIILGQSTATLRQIHRVATAGAWGTQLSVASVAGSGRTAATYTGCGGTSKKGHENNIAGVTIPGGVATVDAVNSTVRTTDTSSGTVAVAHNTIAGISLFNGMVELKALKTQANAKLDNKGHHTRSPKGTTLGSLIVDGQTYSVPKLGQTQSIPGLGSLTFGYTHLTKTGILVNGIRLVLGSAQGGLPAGAVITVGAARAKVIS
ncbi:choice-of-anchor P family protein [Jatrophihabitans endophyticus]|uniref:choice-of-anchor P family protein n=1 Tax=Jatrophihabitans endophyticus TaxID=1206085 RepID=UPI0019E043B1|nr:choice-of-anchor P family protein [Jatrophihabitans endophyticus]MBE7188063.1 hypothetical protein [Jatrophihabitans endophyticus]